MGVYSTLEEKMHGYHASPSEAVACNHYHASADERKNSRAGAPGAYYSVHILSSAPPKYDLRMKTIIDPRQQEGGSVADYDKMVGTVAMNGGMIPTADLLALIPEFAEFYNAIAESKELLLRGSNKSKDPHGEFRTSDNFSFDSGDSCCK